MIKALTLTQPWATLIATGDKRIETRGWYTLYRGPLAIHAAKTIPEWASDWAHETAAVQTMLHRAGYDSLDHLPLGCVVATCQIVACVETGCVDFTRVASKEKILGNFSPGRWAFFLEDVMRVDPPVPARGSLGLWDWDNEAAGVEVLVTGRLF